MDLTNRIRVNLPELAFVGVTRALAGAGAALLLTKNMSRDGRSKIGFGLLLAGLVTTIPIAASLITEFQKNKKEPAIDPVEHFDIEDDFTEFFIQ